MGIRYACVDREFDLVYMFTPFSLLIDHKFADHVFDCAVCSFYWVGRAIRSGVGVLTAEDSHDLFRSFRYEILSIVIVYLERYTVSEDIIFETLDDRRRLLVSEGVCFNEGAENI